MWELIVLLVMAFCIMACGVIPVIYQTKGENKPSPCTCSAEEIMFEGITNDAATQTTVNAITPTAIPDCTATVLNNRGLGSETTLACFHFKSTFIDEIFITSDVWVLNRYNI